MTTPDATYRVVRLPEPLRDRFKKARDARQLTNADFIGQAVEAHLPRLLEGLTTLGFSSLTGKTHATRLPFPDQYATLDVLREASQSIGLPATQLLALCLSAATAESPRQNRVARRTKKPGANRPRKRPRGHGRERAAARKTTTRRTRKS